MRMMDEDEYTGWELRHGDGSVIDGEYTWVEGGNDADPDLEGWWEGIDTETVVVATRLGEATRRYEIRPSINLCPECHGEEVDSDGARCDLCLGDGTDPRDRIERLA